MQLFGLDKFVLNFEGDPIPKKPGNFESMDYKDMIIQIIEADPIPGQYLAEAKEVAFNLCERLSKIKFNGKAFDISVAEIALIKVRAGVVASPLALGRISNFLDNNKDEDKN